MPDSGQPRSDRSAWSSDPVTPIRRRAGLSGLALVELRELAAELGLRDTAGMRKSDLIAAIKERQSRINRSELDEDARSTGVDTRAVTRALNNGLEPGSASSRGSGMPELPAVDIARLARLIGIVGAENMSTEEQRRRIKVELVAAAARHEPVYQHYNHDKILVSAIIDYLYDIDQSLIATAISTLHSAARDMYGIRTRLADIFDADSLAGNQWDVLQNYAEIAFERQENERRRNSELGESEEFFEGRVYPYDLIVASYDPAWRSAFKVWADQNKDLLPDTGMESIPAFEYAASGDLDRYIQEFATGSVGLNAALNAGRLPFPPDLVERSPELAQLAAKIWTITSPYSPVCRQLFEINRPSHDNVPLPDAVSRDGQDGASTLPLQEDFLAQHEHRSHAQAKGALLEQGMLGIFERLFKIEPESWQAEVQGGRRRPQIRRQLSGTQYGADIVIRFKGEAYSGASTCLVECKNYATNTAGLSVGVVADKVLQAEADFDSEPVDHWILISPNLDPNNELDRLVERWNTARRFPFTIQIWSPQTGVRELFGIDPKIYLELYGERPPESNPRSADVIAEFRRRLQPPIRLTERLRRYVQDPLSFVELNERSWLNQLETQIVRFGFDERGSRLSNPLDAEVFSALVESPRGSNVALLMADFGEGKSFFTVSLCVHLQQKYLTDASSNLPIPIRLHLRGYRHVSAPVDFLRTQLEFLGLALEDWSELRRGNVFVILDGLDEMSVRQDPETTRSNLDKIGTLLELLDGLPILVTSRPHFFASDTDRERFYDRLRRPHVFRMAQPDRRDTVTHLRAYAESLDLTAKLNKIKELYDPIGLAGKVLFLEMIKKTLPELPEDHFDELVLYETYVRGSLTRKIELLRDFDSTMTDAALIDNMEQLLETISIDIHVGGEGSVDLRDFVAQWRGAAHLLWQTSQLNSPTDVTDADASARIGSRSLLRRVGPEDEGPWLVDFFHRSMKEYFVSKALYRALNADDPFAATRALLLKAPIQPEILGFFRLLADANRDVASVLASLAHSALIDSGNGILGGGAVSLCHAAGHQLAGSDWRSLKLDGAILTGADLSGCDFQHSTLRAADLSSTDLSGADLRFTDLTGANLEAGGNVISLAPDAIAHRYLCLTRDCELGRISVQIDGSIRFSVMQLPRTLHWPENVYLLKEDLILVTGHSEFLIADIGGEAAREVAYFRVSSHFRHAAVVGQSRLGLVFEPEPVQSEALLVDIDGGAVQWRVPVAPGGDACGWFASGLVIETNRQLLLFNDNGVATRVDRRDSGPSCGAVFADGDQAILLTEDGRQKWISLKNTAVPQQSLTVHPSAATAVTAANGDVLSGGADGSVVLVRRGADGIPTIVASVERRLRCAGARVENMASERERGIFTANGAI